MPSHPEVPGDSPLGELMKLSEAEVVDVWCKGCQDWRKMNAAYARILQGEIEACGKCR